MSADSSPPNKVALGICSSISIYKSCEIVRLFQKKGCEVYPFMTRNAARMVSPLLLTALTGHRVIVDPFAETPSEKIDHVALAREVSLFLVAPATANMTAKLASGVADDFISTFYLAVHCPVLIAPAMNQAMYLHKRSQENMKKLRSAGVKIVEPDKGYLACGDEGWGRLASPETIVDRGVRMMQQSRSLVGKTVLVTAGPTREYLDPVRYLSNRSSGKMGYAMAEEAVKRGARVILVSGPSELYPPVRSEYHPVTSAGEMADAVSKFAGETDVVVMAAAVSDYTRVNTSKTKIKKTGAGLDVHLEPTKDILRILGEEQPEKILVGFAAETDNVIQNARKKAVEKKLDLIVANDVSRSDRGFDSDDNLVHMVYPDGKEVTTDLKSKAEISEEIWNEIEGIIERKG